MKQDCTIIWNNCLDIIRDNLGSELNFKTWFEPIKALKLENNTLTIQVPSHFFYEWLEEHYVDLLRSSIKRELGNTGKLEYSILMTTNKHSSILAPSGNKKETKNQDKIIPIQPKNLPDPFIMPGIRKIKINPQLNEKLNFDNFVEGECNRLARSAGYAIANKMPGETAFNPLFIFGNTGLGKTHLMNAIGLQAKRNFPELTVLYVSAELFTQQFVDACKNKSINDFIHFYQLIDILLIDDIHKLAGREGTQNACFNIFNHLQQNKKQIILSSDKAPVELEGIEPRLLSRFKWGISADLQIPDVETRISILEKKLYVNGAEAQIPENVIEYIAYSCSTNVREMEGVLNSLLAQSILNKKTITLELAKQITDKIVKNSSKEISIDFIQKIICDYFGLAIEQINSATRRREIVQARQLAMFFSKRFTKTSLAAIGAQCGKKNHATVLHACKNINNLMETDRGFKSIVDELSKKIKA